MESRSLPPPVAPGRSTDTAEARTSPPLRVCLVPYYDDNPYQQQLVDHLRRLGVDVSTRTRLKGLLRDVRHPSARPDVVHLHWLPGFDGKPVVVLRLIMFMLRVMLLRWQGIRIVWTVHNLYAHEGQHRWVERLFIRDIIRCASRLIVHSDTAAQLVRHEFGIRDAQKLVVIPHGHYLDAYPNTVTRAEARRKLGLPSDSPVLLFFGKIRPYKGVQDLVRAFEELAMPSATLIIAGSPHNGHILREIAQDIGRSTVRLQPEYVPVEEVQVYMNAADAVVFPYQSVLTSGAVILAMSFGKACIATRLGCICDILDQEGAILFDTQRPDALRDALKEALENSSRLEEMGRFNLERARQWDWTSIAQATIAVYQAAEGCATEDKPSRTAAVHQSR